MMAAAFALVLAAAVALMFPPDGVLPRTAVFATTWALFGCVAQLLVYGRPSTATSLVSALGVTATALSTGSFTYWILGTYGGFDLEYIGVTGWLYVVVPLLAIALAGFAASEHRVRPAYAVLIVVCALSIAYVTYVNLPGAAEGVGPSGITLVLSLASAVFLAATSGIAIVLRGRLGRSIG